MTHRHEASLDYPERCNRCGCHVAHDECEPEQLLKPSWLEPVWRTVALVVALAVSVVVVVFAGKAVWAMRLLVFEFGPFALSIFVFTRTSMPTYVTRFAASLGTFYLANTILFHSFASRVAAVTSLGDFGQITLILAAALGFSIWYYSGRFEELLRPWTGVLAIGTVGWFLFKLMLLVLQLNPWLTHGMTDILSNDGP